MQVLVLNNRFGMQLPLIGKKQAKIKVSRAVKRPDDIPDTVMEALNLLPDILSSLEAEGRTNLMVKTAIEIVAKKTELQPTDVTLLQMLVKGSYHVYQITERDGFLNFLIYFNGKWQYMPADNCIPVGH